MTGITAIVPTMNRPQLLRQCVESLLAQTRPLSEILVVDDGSELDVAQALAGLAGPIRIIRQPNRGKAAAVNLGLSEARGDYIWICDDDDLALPDAAARLGAALDGSDAGFAYGSFQRFRDDPQTGERRIFGPGYWPADGEHGELFSALLDDFFIFQFATLVRRSAFETVGVFREDLVRSQDYEMILRLARAFEGRRVEGPLFLQREHDAPRGSQADGFDAARSFEKWIEYDQKIFADLLCTMPIEEFAPAALRSADPAVRLRAAHLKRGCVLARRKLWKAALAEFRHACALSCAAPPTPEETAIAGRILNGKYGCREVVDDRALLNELAEAFRVHPYGRHLVGEVARPLRWRAREALLSARLREGVGYLAALARLMGRTRAAAFLLGAAAARLLPFQRGPRPALVT
ncbi:glycosyltransferase family 2 protein [Phenylobacterium deserti]|nr:glycosyltransferase family 2 protein [Phenylobacterium deserti]